jgi:hypothetical protein
MENRKQAIEIADILRDNQHAFMNSRPLCAVQQKALEDIMSCRTSELGGHSLYCNNCHHKVQSYNSCRNRNCPKCQYVKQVQWVDKLAANLPSVKHFHIVFTIPSCLHGLFYINQRIAYGLLFKAAGQALMQCAKNTHYLGVQAGVVALLHTWGQTLTYHPHIHTIVPAGGLSDDGMEWIASAATFFVPVKVLSAVFRGILCRLLQESVSQGHIKLPDDLPDFQTLKTKCYAKKWVVYAEKPFSSSENLIRYLGNYTHRVAIGNHRIVDYRDGKVTFSYKDNKSGGTRKNMTMDAREFIRRFVQHVLPSGFCKIRYFGFMAMCNRKSQLDLCFSLIVTPSYLSTLTGLQSSEVMRLISGKDSVCCPKCSTGRLMVQPSENWRPIESG